MSCQFGVILGLGVHDALGRHELRGLGRFLQRLLHGGDEARRLVPNDLSTGRLGLGVETQGLEIPLTISTCRSV